jgi:hypothetical protein
MEWDYQYRRTSEKKSWDEKPGLKTTTNTSKSNPSSHILPDTSKLKTLAEILKGQDDKIAAFIEDKKISMDTALIHTR